MLLSIWDLRTSFFRSDTRDTICCTKRAPRMQVTALVYALATQIRWLARVRSGMLPITVMAVSYTRTVLTVSLSIVASAYSLWEPSYRYLIDSELGYDMRDLLDEEGYWRDVKMRLEQIMIENPGYDRPAKVLLMGDCVKDKNFQIQLFEALGDQMEIIPEIFSSQAEVVAARGVAELTKRESFRLSEAQGHGS